MKKAFLVAGLAVAISIGAAAQTKKKDPPPPPKPPKPSVEVTDRVPPPPPPPPAPPAPPVPSSDDLENLPDDFKEFLNRNPSIKSVYWTENAIVIVPKTGKKERYSLNEKGIQTAEAKYGKLPTAPPPPPPPPAPPVPPKPEQ